MPHECITHHVKEALGSFSNCDSVSLRFSKIVKYPRAGEQEEKANEIENIINCFERKKRRISLPDLTFLPEKTRKFALRLEANLIVNQANGILENAGICFHRFFDYPYIPGSAVKGVARHAAWEKWASESDDGKKLEIAEKIASVFGFPTGDKKPDENASDRLYLDDYLWEKNAKKYGSKNEPNAFAGTIAFMDAIPESTDTLGLVADICTCHHPDYYNPTESSHPFALDDEDPNPQVFPTVQAGSDFLFCLVPLKPDSDLKSAEEFLRAALTINGVGGKTAAGYGWFSSPKELEEKYREQLSADPEIEDLLTYIKDCKYGGMKTFLQEDFNEKKKEAFSLALKNNAINKYTLRDLKEDVATRKRTYKTLVKIFGEEETNTLFNS